ncbi:MAG: alpha/beta fold hydrolase [Duodenibacillus sp.]|nr:alpha/beta fold hydrolase [Duodenibacillus sp.]
MSTDPACPLRRLTLPLEREGRALHLEGVLPAQGLPAKGHVLLVHGLTYSSHQFDLAYGDYSFAEFLARSGRGAWMLDLSGYGRSAWREDGLALDAGHAAEDARLAAEAIRRSAGCEAIDALGWSRGTLVASRLAARCPGLVRRLVLYAPILSGLGREEVAEQHHANTWEHAAGDLRKGPDGLPDAAYVEPGALAAYASACWRVDGRGSPNGARRELFVDPAAALIDARAVKAPTLVIAGTADPYIDWERFEALRGELPAGSRVETVEDGGHAMLFEKPFYRAFRSRVLAFLEGEA